MLLVVTRPEPDASRTARALAALGHQVIVSPALDIVVDPAAPLPAGPFQAVIATSSNGVRALAEHSGRVALQHLPLFAVGDQTALEARRAGFAAARSASGAATDLVRIIAAELSPSGGPLLSVSGDSPAADIAGALHGIGFSVETAVLYRSEPRIRLADEASAALRDGRVGGVLFFSRRSAAAFAQALAAAGLAPMGPAVRCFCLAPSCAEPLAPVTSGPVVVAERPDQISLFASIEAVQPSHSALGA